MLQEILMWTSVAGAFGYTSYSFGKVIWGAYQENKASCSGTCGGCSAKSDLLKNIKLKDLKPVRFIDSNH